LRPVPLVTRERLARLLADLDAEEFEVRKGAFAELEKFGEPAGPDLRKVLEGQPPAEVRRQAEELLPKLRQPIPAPERLREIRSVEVLEQIGTPEARTVLEALAGGAPEARLTQEAKASLERLAKRPAASP
jgi:hypothetical protein